MVASIAPDVLLINVTACVWITVRPTVLGLSSTTALDHCSKEGQRVTCLRAPAVA